MLVSKIRAFIMEEEIDPCGPNVSVDSGLERIEFSNEIGECGVC